MCCFPTEKAPNQLDKYDCCCTGRQRLTVQRPDNKCYIIYYKVKWLNSKVLARIDLMSSSWGDSWGTSGCLQNSNTITGLSSRHVTTRLYQSPIPLLVSTRGRFYMISNEDNLERPVAQMRVLRITAFCCLSYSVWGSCSLFVPILMWVTSYDSSFVQYSSFFSLSELWIKDPSPAFALMESKEK